MEKVSDILGNIKDRLSSPLIFSFIISWPFFNWEITVALVWYDPNQLKTEGYSTIFELIRENSNNYNSLLYPALVALGYTFIYPAIKNVITWTNSAYEKWKENWDLKITEGSNVPIEKYMRLRSDLDKRTKTLEDAISQETETLKDMNKLRNELFNSQNKINELEKIVSESRTFNNNLENLQAISGSWIISRFHPAFDNPSKIRVEIANEIVYQLNGPTKTKLYTIEDFYNNINSNTIFFTLRKEIRHDPNREDDPIRNQIKSDLAYIHRLNPRGDELIGYELNEETNIKIVYTRPDRYTPIEKPSDEDEPF